MALVNAGEGGGAHLRAEPGFSAESITLLENGTPVQVMADDPVQEGGGVWDPTADCSVPQCELGCCLIGDQAAFVTNTRCRRLSGLYPRTKLGRLSLLWLFR